MLKEGSTQGVKKAILKLELKPRGAEVQLSVYILKGGEQEEKGDWDSFPSHSKYTGLVMWHVETRKRVELHEKKNNFMKSRARLIMQRRLCLHKSSHFLFLVCLVDIFVHIRRPVPSVAICTVVMKGHYVYCHLGCYIKVPSADLACTQKQIQSRLKLVDDSPFY